MADIIEFPSKTKAPEVVTEQTVEEKTQEYVDNLFEYLFQGFLSELKDCDEFSGVQIANEEDDEFVSDICMSFEFVRATLYRSLKLDNVLHELLDQLKSEMEEDTPKT